jgi:hypothetical protein
LQKKKVTDKFEKKGRKEQLKFKNFTYLSLGFLIAISNISAYQQCHF